MRADESLPLDATAQREHSAAEEERCEQHQRARCQRRRSCNIGACSALTRKIARRIGVGAGRVAAHAVSAEAGGTLRGVGTVPALNRYALSLAAADGPRDVLHQVWSGHAVSERDVVLARYRIAGSTADNARVWIGAGTRYRKVSTRALAFHRRQVLPTCAIGKTARYNRRWPRPGCARSDQDCHHHRHARHCDHGGRRVSRFRSPGKSGSHVSVR